MFFYAGKGRGGHISNANQQCKVTAYLQLFLDFADWIICFYPMITGYIYRNECCCIAYGNLFIWL